MRGILDRPKRGVYLITKEGRKVTATNPKSIGSDFLMQYPKFVDRDFSKREYEVTKITETVQKGKGMIEALSTALGK